MLYQFLLYRAKNGAEALPPTPTANSSQDDKLLHGWIQQQRRHVRQYKDGERSHMTPERLSVLEHVKFPLALRGDEFWKANYEKLREYHATTGHCRVPHNFQLNQKLGDWVTDQRRQHRLRQEGKPSQMTDDRKAKLDALNFEFSVRERVGWDQRLEELVLYRDTNGNCAVPQSYAPNKALGKWVAKQREQFRNREEGKHSSLTDERLKRLEDIGFKWCLNKSKRDVPAAAAGAMAAGGTGVVNNRAQQHDHQTARKYALVAQHQPQQLQPQQQEQAMPAPVRPEKRQKTAPPILLPLQDDDHLGHLG
mmetsp:Transcript_19390/g.55803  ORF Transcript_19390/g.55803 Transcript_19390/m.55803 type:complete len:308 (-) Transcript_19390:52-975(-)